MTAGTSATAQPAIVSAAEWELARAELLVAEKRVTRAEDAVAAQRRRLPMVRVRRDYAFSGPAGRLDLLDLFAGRSQLVLYQFMDAGPGHLCPGCSWFTHGVPGHALERLAEKDVSWATVSDMPLEQMSRAWASMGWTIPYASSHGTPFSADLGAGGGFQLNVFLRDGDKAFRTYSTTQRGVDRLVFTNSIADLLPYGRQEDWEDSPEGWPQLPTYG